MTLLTTPWANRIINVFDAMPFLMAILNAEGSVVYMNEAMLTLMGDSLLSVQEKPYWELDCWIHSDDMQNRVLFAMEQSAIHDTEIRMESQFKDASSEILDIDFHIKALWDELTSETYFLATGFNVTNLVFSRGALSEKERQMQALFDYSHEGFFMNILPEGLHPEPLHGNHHGKKTLEDCLIDDFIMYQKVERSNKAFKTMLGYGVDQELESKRLYELIQIHGKHYRDLVKQLLNHGEVKLEYSMVDRNNQERILELYMVLIYQQGFYYGNFGVLRDLTVQRKYERELEFFAFRDALTGLENRRTFFQNAYRFYESNGRDGVVLMMDIDHFKRVNDSYGHAIGDQVLVGLSKQLLEITSDRVCVARYGGEEFVVLLKGYSVQEACDWSESLIGIAKEQVYYTENGDVFHITISIGLSEIWSADVSVDATITRADKALYHSKQSGRDRWTLCELSQV